MTSLLKKYSIIVIIVFVVVKLLTAIILTVWPDLLITKVSEIETRTLGTVWLEKGIEYIFNIFIVILLFKEMKKGNLISIPILILTFFSNLLGIIFFFLWTAKQRLYISK